jgi:hypothetical protein
LTAGRLDDAFRRAALAADIIRNRAFPMWYSRRSEVEWLSFPAGTFAASPLWSMRARIVGSSDLRIVSNPVIVSDTEWELPDA